MKQKLTNRSLFIVSASVLAVAALTSSPVETLAQTSPQITSSVFASGGETGTGGGYTIIHTLGETIAGTASGGNYTFGHGFLAQHPDGVIDLFVTSSLSPIVVTENIARNLTLTVANCSSISASNVQLRVNLPTGLRALSATNSAGTSQVTSSNVLCSVPLLASNATFTTQISLVANVLPVSSGEFVSLADLSGMLSASAPDSNPNDNSVALQVTAYVRLDWGDARGGFPVTRAENGARHRFVPGYRLGALWDSEGDGVHSLNADWDDNPQQQSADEDGVFFVTSVIRGGTATVVVVSSFNGFLDAWADFKGNTNWSDAGEQIFASQPLVVGSNTLSFDVPPDAMLGMITTRWRASTTGGLSYTGYGDKGEIEDYMVSVQAPAVTPPRPNLSRVNGATTLSFQTETNASYRIEYTDALGAQNWSILMQVAGTGQPVSVTDNSTNSARFYRVVIAP